MSRQFYVQFAQAYGEGAYSDCNYNDTTSCASVGGGTSAGGAGAGGANAGSGALSDTGIWVALIVAIACLIMFVALVVRFWRRPVRQEVRTEDFAPKGPEDEEPPAARPGID